MGKGKNSKKNVGKRSGTPAGRRTAERAPSTTEDGATGKKCQHISKNVKPTKFKKKLTAKKIFSANCEVTQCQSNQEDGVWVCLKCAHRGCGRYSEEQHALKHNSANEHPLAVNLSNWQIWCYACDCALDTDSSRDLQLCVAELRRRLGGPGQDRKHYHPPSSSAVSAVLPPSVKGLSNIGNTCFFNAVIQNLNQTILLHHRLKHVAATGWKMTVEVPDGSLDPLDVVIMKAGDVTDALCSLLGDMSDPSKKGALTPRNLFNSLRAKVHRFEGYRQQDSHELLRHLLDEMKTEEIMRVKRAILVHFHVADSSKAGRKDLTDKDRESIRCYGRSVNHTFVDEVFGGELISTIVCKQCGQVSKLVEGFLDLSLPVQSEFKHHKNTPASISVPPDTALSKHQLKKQKEESKKQQKHDAKLNKKKATTMNLSQLHTYVDSNTPGKQEVGGTNEEMGGANEEVGGANEEAPRPNGSQVPDAEEEVKEEVGKEETPGKVPPCLTGSDGSQLAGTFPTTGSDSALQAEVCGEESCYEESQIQEDLSEHVQSVKLRNSADTSTAETPCDNGIAAVIPTEPEDNTREEDVPQPLEEVPRPLEEVPRPLEEVPQPLAVSPTTPTEGELEYCLMRFTSSELLTGKDMYACDRCTERRRQQTRAAQRDCKANGTGQTKGKTHTELGTERFGNGDVKQHATDQSDAEGGSDEVKEETVFAEADKRFLVQRLPPVLTLHLKRFEQRGMMRVTKNNRHVAFPRLLDMAPFCTCDSEELTDSDGRLLYSLYGVVEHHGSMAGGHYVAYVRVRPSVVPERGVTGTPPEKDRRSGSAGAEGAEEEEGQTSPMPHQSQCVDQLAEGESNGAMVPGKQVGPSEEEGVEPAKKQEYVTASESDSNVENPIRQGREKPSEADKNVEKSVDQKSGEPSRLDQGVDLHSMVHSLSEDNSSVRTQEEGDVLDEGRRFDLSSIAGQWYYISDSQVSVVSENRVLNSQAFLLFYEKLPLIDLTRAIDE